MNSRHETATSGVDRIVGIRIEDIAKYDEAKGPASWRISVGSLQKYGTPSYALRVVDGFRSERRDNPTGRAEYDMQWERLRDMSGRHELRLLTRSCFIAFLAQGIE
jgi:hypothetical protein